MKADNSEKISAVYWGAFDPPTIAHVKIIEKVLQSFKLQSFFLVFNKCKNKSNVIKCDVTKRQEMMKLALKDIKIDLDENHIKFLSQESDEYSYKNLKSQIPTDTKLYAVVGLDSFIKYHESCKLLDHTIVISREMSNLSDPESSFLLQKYSNVSQLYLSDNEFKRISSSNARKMIEDKNYSSISSLLTESVVNFIQRNSLYSKTA